MLRTGGLGLPGRREQPRRTERNLSLSSITARLVEDYSRIRPSSSITSRIITSGHFPVLYSQGVRNDENGLITRGNWPSTVVTFRQQSSESGPFPLPFLSVLHFLDGFDKFDPPCWAFQRGVRTVNNCSFCSFLIESSLICQFFSFWPS